MKNNWLEKLERLSELEGYSNSDELITNSFYHSVVPGICMNEDCDNIEHCEPDQRHGYCSSCGTRTVESCLSLGGLA